ncbi:Arc family DNA-binding protein [Devosia faecipullorum]|uniref:Arc family DNA-binding protein n=1 Tax=Devosia faecipullorum TaxID=2755039 RepID=UPI00187B2CF3|nr:Arc family DNA-binding protein [Devosia faecipullorum]MBE7731461.1 Arc family DNA-binding protein [Devosia faecipullorum]
MITAAKPFGLRLPDDMKAWVAARAADNGRSMNSEIAQILKAHMTAEQPRKKVVLRKPAKAGAL